MLAEERFAIILDILDKQKTATVLQLATALQASESTVRRDLIFLADQGKLHKVHGGATAYEAAFEPGEAAMSAKEQLNVQQKRQIARYAAALVVADDVIFLDAGSTTLLMVDYLEPSLNATFVTNGVLCAQKLVQKGLKAYVLGGLLKVGTEAVVGAAAAKSLAGYNFTKAFIGTNGISVQAGYTTPDPEEALLKELAIGQARTSYVLADASKFGRLSAVTIAPLGEAAIITDRLPDPVYSQHTTVKEATE